MTSNDSRIVRCGGCGGWLARTDATCQTCGSLAVMEATAHERQRVRQSVIVALAGLDDPRRADEAELCHAVYNDALDEQQLRDELDRLRLAQ